MTGVLLLNCVAPGMIVILLVLSILLVLFLPEEMTLNQGEAHQGDSQYHGHLHSDEERLPT